MVHRHDRLRRAGVALLYLPREIVSHMRVAYYYWPGYALYGNLTGTDFDGGGEWWHYAVIVGGTAIVWGTLATILVWIKEKFESVIAYASFVAFIVVAAVFLMSAYNMIPKMFG